MHVLRVQAGVSSPLFEFLRIVSNVLREFVIGRQQKNIFGAHTAQCLKIQKNVSKMVYFKTKSCRDFYGSFLTKTPIQDVGYYRPLEDLQLRP